MIRFYADNSELRGIWGAEIPDILLFGGIAVNEEAKNDICSTIKAIKSTYQPDVVFPLKWNFRDLEKYFREHELNTLYSKLLEDSRTWRSEIFQRVSGIDIKIIISIIISYGSSRETLVNNPGLTSGAFNPMQASLVLSLLFPGTLHISLSSVHPSPLCSRNIQPTISLPCHNIAPE